MDNIDKNMFKCLSQRFIDDWKTLKILQMMIQNIVISYKNL